MRSTRSQLFTAPQGALQGSLLILHTTGSVVLPTRYGGNDSTMRLSMWWRILSKCHIQCKRPLLCAWRACLPSRCMDTWTEDCKRNTLSQKQYLQNKYGLLSRQNTLKICNSATAANNEGHYARNTDLTLHLNKPFHHATCYRRAGNKQLIRIPIG